MGSKGGQNPYFTVVDDTAQFRTTYFFTPKIVIVLVRALRQNVFSGDIAVELFERRKCVLKNI